MSMKRYELTKEQWERIKPLLPPEETGKRGRPRKDNRIMLNPGSRSASRLFGSSIPGMRTG
ncbi:transposase [Intestinimonas timonensis]|uniref:transposase n=1 Tax=Intestinimonas timonensis TaxID=1689270 RepID=UPI001A914D54